MWSLEQELEDVTPDDDDVRDLYGDLTFVTDPNKWFLREMVRRAAQLWRGEQVDGTVHDRWGLEDDGVPDGPPKHPTEVIRYSTAVMAGWRYLTSFKSTPQYVRPGMHDLLFIRSYEYH